MNPGIRLLRNIAFKLALIVMSAALAAFGILGWAHAANAFEAVSARSWADLDALWPLYVVAAIACLAAQVIAACAVVNLARLAHAFLGWRVLAFAFYAVAVFFAAYSADKGAQVILTSAHRAAYEARETQRVALTAEISDLAGLIEREREKLPSDTANTVTSRQQVALAIFEATTASASARLPEARRELAASPPLPREPEQAWQLALGVFLIFLAWAILEPWGYALAERGREQTLPVSQPVPIRDAPASHPSQRAKVPWLRRVAAFIGFALLSHGATIPPAHANEPTNPCESREPLVLSATMDAKAVAFSMRGRFAVQEIAAKVDVHQATVYRWFRARDLAAKQAA